MGNSKTLFHLLPELIPPIDRQYTVRFFEHSPDRWKDASGKFRVVTLPKGIDAQFELFHKTCVSMKRLADKVGRAIVDAQRQPNGVTPPKAVDNAIVNYVRMLARARVLLPLGEAPRAG